MIHKIRIRPAVVYGTYLHICQFTDPVTGELISLVDNGKNGRVIKGELPVGKSPKVITFEVNPKKNNFYYEFSFDDTNVSTDDFEAYTKYWLKDMRVQPPVGAKNPNYYRYDASGNILGAIGVNVLVIEDVTTSEINKKSTGTKKSKVFQKYTSLSEGGEVNGFRAAKNVAYYFGVAGADKMNDVELFNTLIGDFNGILMQEGNIDKFLSYESEDFFTQLSINTMRAIETGMIEKKINAGKLTYFINNHPVGDSENAVITYLDNNKDFYYQYVVEKLGDAAETKRKEKESEIKGVIETVDVNALKHRAEELFATLTKMGVKGAKVGQYKITKNPDKLMEAIKEAEEIINERSQTEITA